MTEFLVQLSPFIVAVCVILLMLPVGGWEAPQ